MRHAVQINLHTVETLCSQTPDRISAGPVSTASCHSLKRVLTIAIVSLCALIFAWGLQYKLSLYQTPPTPMPAAKLLADKGDSAAQISTPLVRFSSTIPGLSVLALALFVFSIRARKLLAHEWSLDHRTRYMHALSLAYISRFFPRPPPSRT